MEDELAQRVAGWFSVRSAEETNTGKLIAELETSRQKLLNKPDYEYALSMFGACCIKYGMNKNADTKKNMTDAFDELTEILS